MEIFEKLQEMIADQLSLNKDDIKPESNIIKDLHADSLDLVETLMNIENEWGITEGTEYDAAIRERDRLNALARKKTR